MRRSALAIAVALASLVCAAPAAVGATAPSAVSLAPAGSNTFPARSFALTVPERRGLRPADIKVTENGEPVDRLSLASADGERRGDFGAILVIDASKSMRGAAIRNAVAAARELARQRTGGQQIGVIAFNATPTVLLAPTSDAAAIDRALAKLPALAPQTHIFDAVGRALDLLKEARITAGSIVLLSDGADTGSLLRADAATALARKANVAIYTVGLRSGASNSGELRKLASAGRGRYTAAASVKDLRRIYTDIGAQLASDYLVRYRSSAEPGTEVTVAVRVAGVAEVATSSYVVPGEASYIQVRDSFWTSNAVILIIGGICALLVLVGLGNILLGRVRGPDLRERVRGFVTPPGDLSPSFDVTQGKEGGRRTRARDQRGWRTDLERDMEVGRMAMEPGRLILLAALATVLVMALLVKLTGIPLVGVFALAIPWATRRFVQARLRRQRLLFIEQLPDLLQGAASAIRAGHGLVAGLSMVADNAPEPIRSEFMRAVADEGLGVPLEEALGGVQERMASREVLQIALIAQIQREAGGNMAEVLDRITETLRRQGELRRMVQALTAQGRLSRWVVSALPVALLLVISVLNPDYVRPLFTEPLGLLLLVVAAGMMVAGSATIGKIVNFKV